MLSMRLHRYALLALVMTSTGASSMLPHVGRTRLMHPTLITLAALAGALADDDDVDRTDFSDPALSEDKDALGPQGPHSDVEPAWILPDCPDGSKSPPPHDLQPSKDLAAEPLACEAASLSAAMAC